MASALDKIKKNETDKTVGKMNIKEVGIKSMGLGV